MRALVIEDNIDIGECIVDSLSDMGIASDWFTEGRYLDSAIAVADFDLIVLDINLPDTDGFTILKKFRGLGHNHPVLIISARIAISDRVMGLDIGADDYLTKPFAIDEFEARVRSLLRRESTSKCELINFGDLSYNQSSRTFKLNNRTLNVTPRESSVLEILLQKRGDCVNKEHIANHIFNFDNLAGTSSIEIYVHRLRKVINNSNIIIATKRGRGYRLELDENKASK